MCGVAIFISLSGLQESKEEGVKLKIEDEEKMPRRKGMRLRIRTKWETTGFKIRKERKNTSEELSSAMPRQGSRPKLS